MAELLREAINLVIQTESSDTEMKVYRASSEINRNDIKMRALGRKRSGLGLEQMKLSSIVGICVLAVATLVQCIGATGTCLRLIFPFLSMCFLLFNFFSSSLARIKQQWRSLRSLFKHVKFLCFVVDLIFHENALYAPNTEKRRRDVFLYRIIITACY